MQEYVVDDLKPQYISGIMDLFINNYEDYHYKALLDLEGILCLLKQRDFVGIVILSEDSKWVAGFAGYYIEEKMQRKIYRLAHLLVAKSYRKNGFGVILEEKRLEKIRNDRTPAVIYASCVEYPPYSIILKKNRGFHMCGIRIAYRPGEDGSRKNSVIMSMEMNCVKYEKFLIEKPLNTTKQVINDSLTIKYRDVKEAVSYTYKVSTILDNYLDRCFYLIEEDSDGEEIQSIIHRFVAETATYTAISFSIHINGFQLIDRLLQRKNIMPIVYLPGGTGSVGTIEYQFFRKQGVFTYDTYREKQEYYEKYRLHGRG